MPVTVEKIVSLYVDQSGLRYGSELVSQLDHALQTAQLARAEGAGPELCAAAFLHDIGHLVTPRSGEIAREIDDLHQFTALAFLRGAFGVAVLQPIKLHVEAKRYLCGALTPGEAAAFLDQPYARDAVRLRRWDDRAKVPGRPLRELETIREILLDAADCHKTAMAGA